MKDQTVIWEISMGVWKLISQKVEQIDNEKEIRRQKEIYRENYSEVPHLNNESQKKVESKNKEMVIIKELKEETFSEHKQRTQREPTGN